MKSWIAIMASGRVEGVAQISIALTEMRIRDVAYPIQTNVLSFEAETTKNKDAAKVGSGDPPRLAGG